MLCNSPIAGRDCAALVFNNEELMGDHDAQKIFRAFYEFLHPEDLDGIAVEYMGMTGEIYRDPKTWNIALPLKENIGITIPCMFDRGTGP